MTRPCSFGKCLWGIGVSFVFVMIVIVGLALSSTAQAATFKAGLTEEQIRQQVQAFDAQPSKALFLNTSAAIPGVLFSDSFESGLGAWDVVSLGGPTWGTTTYRVSDGTKSAYCVGSTVAAPGPFPAQTVAWMQSPAFSLTGKGAATLDFDYWLDCDPAKGDGLALLFGGSPALHDTAAMSWTGNSSGWQHVSINLGAIPDEISHQSQSFLGLPVVVILFDFDGYSSAGHEGAYIDNVSIKAPPVVTGIGQHYGPVAGGNWVTIIGSGFTGATGVTFGGVAASDVRVINDNALNALAPAHSVGTVDVAVTGPGGTSAVGGAGDKYTYVAAPTITSMVPSQGPTAGGNSVVINGTGFTSIVGRPGVDRVTFGGVPGYVQAVNSMNQMTVVPPAHYSLGTVDVAVTAIGGTSDTSGTADNYTYAPTRYDESHESFGFSSGWRGYANSAFYAGGYRYTNIPGSSVTLAFTGSQFNWITLKGPDCGKAKVVVDDGAPTEVDLYNATNMFQQAVFSTSGLASGVHTVTITSEGTKNASASNTYIGMDAVEVEGSLITVSFAEQNDFRMLYKGAWSGYSNGVFSGGSYHYTKNAGTMIVIPFYGKKFEWIATMGPAYGKANVSLDGGAPTLVDLYADVNQFKQIVYSTGILASGSHTVAISYTGLKNSGATDTYINADAFQVMGAFTPSARVDQINTKFVWTKTWTLGYGYYYFGSSYRYVNVSGASVRINFTGASLSYIAKKAPNMGKAYVSLDGGPAVLVDLYSPTTAYQQKVWSTGTLVPGDHYVTITWSGQKRTGATGTYINVDAVDVVGTIK